MKIRINKNMGEPSVTEIDDFDPEESSKSLSAMLDQVGDIIVSRGEELDALALCLTTGSHLMLKGKHGISKSQLATEVFSRIVGCTVFKKQFIKGTNLDEVLGPMLVEKYKQGVWEHNIKGMLPDCHFFFGDEIYRASDQALPVMMGILNEREFINGGLPIRCPLITAIGTTNFETDSEELEAFHDRWHVHVESQPLATSSDVLTMFGRILALEEKKAKPKTITLSELVSLRKYMRKVTFPDELLELLPEVLFMYGKAANGKYISDRRKVQSLDFIRASALRNGRLYVDVDDIDAARFVVTRLRDTEESQAWNSVLEQQIGDFKSERAEGTMLKKFEAKVKGLTKQFDASMPAKQAKFLLDEARSLLQIVTNADPNDLPQSVRGQTRFDKAKGMLEELCASIEQEHTV